MFSYFKRNEVKQTNIHKWRLMTITMNEMELYNNENSNETNAQIEQILS